MSEITLNYTGSEGLKCVLDAIYVAELSLSEENVCDVVSLESLLQLNEIVQHCENFLKTNISGQNCLSFLSVAEKYGLQEVVEVCNEFVMENFCTISESVEFTKLSKEQICSYLSNDKLKVRNGEIDVFRSALKWYETTQNISQPRDGDSSVLAELMQHVRFALIPSNLLLDEILTNGLISENPGVMRMVTEALRFHSAENLYSQPLKEGKQFQPRGEQKLVVPGTTSRNTGSTVIQKTRMHMLNVKGDEPFQTQFSEQVLARAISSGSFAMVTKGNYLFMFGADAEYFRPIAQCFDARTNTWLDLKPPPIEACANTAAALLNRKIYLLGGRQLSKGNENIVNPSDCSAAAFEYSIETNSWSKLQNLPKPVAFHAAASRGNYVFCAGGLVGDKTTSDRLYAYDVVGKILLSKASMNSSRASFSLEVVRAKLVACGGRNTPNVEFYEVADDQWTLIQNEIIEHHFYHNAIALMVKCT